MKVLFAPYYFYLHYESFKRVAASLNRSGIDAAILHMPCNAFNENRRFGIERIRADGCPVRQLQLCDLGWKGASTIARMTRFPNLLVNRKRTREFLNAERPQLVVVGSDLGGLYVRLLLDCCREAGIQTMILASSASGPPAVDSNAGQTIRVWPAVKALLRMLDLDRVALFDHWQIGSFNTEAPIAVPGTTLKEELLRYGISEDRVFVTGDPAHDAIYELKQEIAAEIRSQICSRLGWPARSHLIVYCTEVIHEMLGRAYLVGLNRLLAQAFADLPDDCRVVVKLHPRETSETEALFRQAFRGHRYLVRRDLNLLRLLRAAHLCVGHYSRTLIDSVLLGTPVACINLARDEKRMLFDTSFSEMRIESGHEFHKIRTLLEDAATRDIVERKLQDWRFRYASALDGESSNRNAALISKILAGSPEVIEVTQ
jgi:hypothetical protein